VDDEYSFHVILKTILPDFDFVSTFTKDEAKEKSRINNFDLMIIDLCFEPGSGEYHGIELIAQFKDLRPDIPIIAVTQFEDRPELETKSLSAGADRFLLKSQYADGEDWQEIVYDFLDAQI